MTIEVGNFVIATLPSGEAVYGFVTQSKYIKNTEQKIHEVDIRYNEEGFKVKEPYKFWVLADSIADGGTILNAEIQALERKLKQLTNLRAEVENLVSSK